MKKNTEQDEVSEWWFNAVAATEAIFMIWSKIRVDISPSDISSETF